jgi:polysaccharide biosynthesis protein PslE
MIERPHRRFSLAAAWELVFRHKKKIMICPLVALIVGGFVLLYCPRWYRSEARLFLRVGRETVALDPTASTGQTIAMQQNDRKDEVKSAVELIKSRGVVSQVVDELGADVVLRGWQLRTKSPSAASQLVNSVIKSIRAWANSIDPISDREEAIILVEGHLSVGAERESTLVVVQYDARSPQLAQKVCDKIVQVYQQAHMRIHRNEESQPFFTQQQEMLRKQLDSSLEALRTAKDEMGLASISDRRATLEKQFGDVELSRLDTEQQLATSQARVTDLEKQLGQLPDRMVSSKRSVPNAGADLLREQLYTLQMKALDLQARYSDSHPLVQAIKQQVEAAQKIVDARSEHETETTEDVNPIHRDLSLELKQQQNIVAGYQSRLAELDKQKALVQADLRTTNQCEVKLDQLERQTELARSKYFQYSHNLEDSRISTELENERISNVSIAQAATLAENPVSPPKPLVIVATLILATAGTATLVFFSEKLNDRLRTEGEVEEALGVPVLATIPDGRHARRVFHTNGSNGNGRTPGASTISRI